MIKNLFIYWNSTFINAPEIVKKCLLSWKIHNPTWTIYELDDINLIEYIDLTEIIQNKTITTTSLSDIIRVSLLKKYGGIWCDATVLCMFPLDSWLFEYIETGFFAFEQKCDRIMSSWFLYSEPNHYIINNLYDSVINYIYNANNIGFSNTNTIQDWNIDKYKKSHYFWFHYLFGDLVKSNQTFNDIWKNTKKISADNPHYLQSVGLTKKINNKLIKYINNNKTQLYKLTYKYNNNNNDKNTIIYYLMNLYKIKFIHIGKCAGTSIVTYFNIEQIHLEKPLAQQNVFWITWIRNPIERYVSAFNFSHSLINIDVSKLDKNNLTIQNCLAPVRIMNKIKKGYLFDITFEKLINYFSTANNLAESITSNDITIREKALQLMNSTEEHIYKGIGWYFDNGDFIEKNHKNILFVGKVETMNTDIEKLGKLLNIKLPNEILKIRENNNNNNKSLSKLAIDNIINFYKDTDYKTINTFIKYNLIDKNVIDEYYNYKYIL
jgi:hypothetical protein